MKNNFYISPLKIFLLTIGVVILGMLFGSMGAQISYADGAQDIIKYHTDIQTDTTVNLPKINQKELPEEKISHILYTVITIILSVVGFVAVVLLVVAGTQYTISTGADDMISDAKKKIIWALSGLMVVIFSYAILSNTVDFLSSPTKNTNNAAETTGSLYTQEELEYIERWQTQDPHKRILNTDERKILIDSKRDFEYVERWEKQNNKTLNPEEKKILLKNKREFDAKKK